MIIAVTELQAMPEFAEIVETTLTRKLKAIEKSIRAYTNNNFQNRLVRFEAPSSTVAVLGISDYLAAGDTVQISESINEGLYTVETVDSDYITFAEPLFEADNNLVTKIVYPEDVIEGVINLLKWDIDNRAKVGVKSETLSRHSITYYDQDANNQLLGYPVSLLGFLKPYIKARF